MLGCVHVTNVAVKKQNVLRIFVTIALTTQHAKRTRHIILSSVAHLDLP